MAPECCAASHTSLQRNYSWNETQAHFSLIRYNPHLKTPESFFVDSLNNCADIAHEYWDSSITIVLLTECDCSGFSSVPPIFQQLLKEGRRLRQKVFSPIQLPFRIWCNCCYLHWLQWFSGWQNLIIELWRLNSFTFLFGTGKPVRFFLSAQIRCFLCVLQFLGIFASSWKTPRVPKDPPIFTKFSFKPAESYENIHPHMISRYQEP